MKADLHTHSTASDGQYSPGEVVSQGVRVGLDVLALTDHDTIDGLPEAEAAGTCLGIQIVRGVEFSAREYPCLHILGYAFDPDSPGLCALCRRLERGRAERQTRILDYLRTKGIPLTLQQVLLTQCAASGPSPETTGSAILSRPHFARAMVRYGYAESVSDAFSRYLGTDEFMRTVERPKPSARECVETLRAAHGHVSLAHPYQLELPDDALDKLLRTLVSYGLDAIECYYPRHTPAQTAFYLRLAERYQLHVTGGSDFHGEQVKPDIRMTPLALNLDWLGVE